MANKTIHVYIGWKVTLPNGNGVNFSVQSEALDYFTAHGTEMVRTRAEMQCGLERGRAFCGHCKEATYTETRNV